MAEIDFLPERIREQRRRKRQFIRQGYLTGLVIIGLAAMTYVFQSRVDAAQGELEMLRSRGKAQETQMALRRELNGQLADLMIKSRIEEQLGRRVSTLDVLRELQRVLPESTTLTNMTMETVEMPVLMDPSQSRNASNRAVTANGRSKPRTVKRVRVVLTGVAPTDVDVANFIGQLAGSKLFEDVSMGYAKNEKFLGSSARKFQANCYLTR